MTALLDRRTFVAAGLVLLLRQPKSPKGQEHPDPRPNVDASHVLTREQLGDETEAAEVFDLVRQIPQIADGIRCHCGCAELPGYRSLLSCFEGEGMARHCQVCQGQARLAYELHKSGRTLGVIRAAIDRRFS